MKIAICDDEPSCREKLKELLNDYSTELNIKFDIYPFCDGTSFLNSDNEYDIVFMDIFLGDVNGVSVAQKYISTKSGNIIFVSQSRDFAVEAFALGATHYLVHPISKKDFNSALSRCIKEKQPEETTRYLVLSNKQGLTKIPISGIRYIEVQNRICNIYATNRQYSFISTLDILSSQLPAEIFFRVQRSFIVNLNYIQNIINHLVILDQGEQISVARDKYKTLKSIYQDFLIKLTRGTYNDF